MSTPEPLIFGTYYRKRDRARVTVGDVERDGAAYRWVTYCLDSGRTYRVSLVGFWKKFES